MPSGILTRPIPDNPEARSRLGRQLPATLQETLSASFEDPLLRPAELAETERELRKADPDDKRIRGGIFGVDVQQQVLDVTEGREDPVDPEILNKDYGDIGLKFDRPVTRTYADILAKGKKEEAIRADILARGPQGIVPGTLRFGAMFASASLDPLNIASAFVPVVSQARYAGMLARMGKTQARITKGFIEGSIGNAAIELPTYGMAQSQQLDYEMSDALVNIAFGGVLGGGLHSIGGKMADFIESRSPVVREQALKTAVVDLVEGRTPDVEPIFRFDEATFTPAQRNIVDLAPAKVESLRAELTGLAGEKLSRGEVKALNSEIVELRQKINQAEASIPEVKKAVKKEPGVKGRQAQKVAEQRVQEDIDLFNERLRVAEDRLQRAERAAKAESELSRVEQSVRNNEDPLEILSGSTQRIRSELPDIDVEQFKVEQILDPERLRPMDFQTAKQEAAQLAKMQAAPERDITADFEAADEATRLLDEGLGANAANEADFANESIAALRESGLLTKEDERLIAEADELLAKAEGYGRGAEAAARCLLR